MLPDVIGTWQFDGNRGDPGGSGPNGGLDDSPHEMEPTSREKPDAVRLERDVAESVLEDTVVSTPTATPASPIVLPVSPPPAPYRSPDPVYLEPGVAESVLEDLPIAPPPPPPVHKRTSILFDPASMERQNTGRKV